ncbi:hypothetical protein CBG25_08070 [Arsenophonus sp. ENCA]|uniref:hypothetical protein n=1 Tax=Arsenophonus sp. ENCA TaxID=1987579 RepID=UPI000BD049EB|nr:hypothetical protein [Arsenophonus sp. ENCA]PAV03372.1 hypothetical protein CBG25_08070 [Arsenophonus sp. ENCA]
MGQVAFDTQEFVETLEKEGLPKNQAKAISIAVRKSHEAVDVATKADIVEVNRNIADVRKDMEFRFEKTDAQIADVRKDLSAEITNVRKDMEIIRKDLQLEMSGIRAEQKLIRWMLGAGILGILSLVVKAFLMPAL